MVPVISCAVSDAAGKKITSVTLEDGKVTVLVDGAQPAAVDNDKVNPWDKVLQNDSDQERAS